MKILTEKMFSKITKPMTNSYRQTSAWLSANIGYQLMYCRTILRYPEDYQEWALKTSVDKLIIDFKTLCDHDKVCAKMLYETYRHDLWDLVRKTYDCNSPVEYFKFYYENEEA